MKIYKYNLEIIDNQRIQTDEFVPTPLHVGEQNGKLMMWVRLDKGLPGKKYQVDVSIFSTGMECDLIGKTYLGTAIMSAGFVWHVYTSLVVSADNERALQSIDIW